MTLSRARVDGPDGMPGRTWAGLVSGFFRGNDLVAENFAELGAQPASV
jgi:hypothetical protein